MPEFIYTCSLLTCGGLLHVNFLTGYSLSYSLLYYFFIHKEYHGMNGEGSLRTYKWPWYGSIGIGLSLVFWLLNWTLPGPRTHWGFFPMWLGYCLTVDALVFTRKGHSLLTRSATAYISLFVLSVPAWWIFEVINWRTQNWHYLGEGHLSDMEYFLLSSLSFSTVMPAVFGTAELAGTFRWIEKMKSGPSKTFKPSVLLILFIAGVIMLVLLLAWPTYFFPFVWLSLYFMIDPLNVWLGNRSLLGYIARGDWRPIFALWTGCMICGFFWEMWNIYSYPKWIYSIPFFDFFHIFEMPVLGYLGYLPFSMELFCLYHLMTGFIKTGKLQNYVQIIPGEIQTYLKPGENKTIHP